MAFFTVAGGRLRCFYLIEIQTYNLRYTFLVNILFSRISKGAWTKHREKNVEVQIPDNTVFSYSYLQQRGKGVDPVGIVLET